MCPVLPVSVNFTVSQRRLNSNVAFFGGINHVVPSFGHKANSVDKQRPVWTPAARDYLVHRDRQKHIIIQFDLAGVVTQGQARCSVDISGLSIVPIIRQKCAVRKHTFYLGDITEFNIYFSFGAF